MDGADRVLAAAALLGLGLPVFFFLLRRPNLVIACMVAAIYSNLSYVAAHQYDIRIVNKAMFAFLALYALCRWVAYEERGAAYRQLLGAFLIWLCAATISMLDSDQPESALVVIFGTISEITPALLLGLVITDIRRVKTAVWSIVATCAVLSSLTIAQYFVGFGVAGGFAQGSVEQIEGATRAWRPSGPLSDANYYAQALLPALALGLDRAVNSGSRTARSLSLVCGVTIAFAILLTGSRGALVAMIGMTLMFLAIVKRLQLLLPVAAGACLALLLLPASYQTRLLLPLAAAQALVSTDGVVEDVAIAGRLSEMRAAVLAFSEHPLSGVGIGQFDQNYPVIAARYDLTLRSGYRAAHSLVLEIAAEQGILGLLAFAAISGLAVVAWRRGLVSAADDVDAQALIKAIGIGVLGYFLASLFLHDAFPRYAWLLLTLMFSVRADLKSNRTYG